MRCCWLLSACCDIDRRNRAAWRHPRCPLPRHCRIRASACAPDSTTPPKRRGTCECSRRRGRRQKFAPSTNSDLAFTGNYAIQGNYNGFQIWDISNPAKPALTTAYYCPASQSDVSVYKNLLFVSGEGTTGRLDCGDQGVRDTVSKDRLRGIRIFDITDITNPKYIGNVQTCRGSHTHTVLVDPKDNENIYVYISGSARRPLAEELPGCVNATPDKDPNSALFRIEVIKVPLAHPEQAAIVSSPRIFNDLTAPPRHGDAAEDVAGAAAKTGRVRKASGGFVGHHAGQRDVCSRRG